MDRRTLLNTLLAAAWLAGAHSAVAAEPDSPWLTGGQPSALARQALAVLADAASHGLSPQDYPTESLSRLLQRAGGDPAAAAELQQALPAALRHYLNDLHRGRIDPRTLQQQFDPRPDPFDADATLQRALAQGQLDRAVRDAAPRTALYGELRQLLAQTRALGQPAAWQRALPALPPGPKGRPGKLEPGQAWSGLPLLAERLRLLGDLPAAAPVGPVYQGALVEAVQAFQERHGLNDDGVIGSATLAQLAVPPAARARQIELTMERLRWTPLTEGRRMVVINIPEFMLRGYEVRQDQIDVQLEMKVIVGKAVKTRTPIFDEDMRFIEFSPYWNVPPSIARAETVPKLRRDPGYLDRQGMEFVNGAGQVLQGVTPDRLDAVLAGQLRIRQRPGPENALGDIKFVFPNSDNIYLHHTPATQLFERERRDFSHGCIRVEQPVALAQFVLREQPEWTEERIRTAMEKGESFTLKLAHPLPVLITYGTVLVKHGRPYYFQDIYGQDRRLDDALSRR